MSGRRGRPAYQPSEEQRRIVEAMVGFGIPEAEICGLIRNANGRPIDEKTLRKHFRDEKVHSRIRAGQDHGFQCRHRHCQLKRPWYATGVGGGQLGSGNSFARLLRCPLIIMHLDLTDDEPLGIVNLADPRRLFPAPLGAR
jgi:hypothetical protein